MSGSSAGLRLDMRTATTRLGVSRFVSQTKMQMRRHTKATLIYDRCSEHYSAYSLSIEPRFSGSDAVKGMRESAQAIGLQRGAKLTQKPHPLSHIGQVSALIRRSRSEAAKNQLGTPPSNIEPKPPRSTSPTQRKARYMYRQEI